MQLKVAQKMHHFHQLNYFVKRYSAQVFETISLNLFKQQLCICNQ